MADKREVKLRVPPEVHKVLKDQAHAEGVSINRLVTDLVTRVFVVLEPDDDQGEPPW